MPWFVTVYLIGALTAIVLSAIGHSKKKEGLQMAAAIIGLISGIVLGIGVFGSSVGGGHYAYYVNGVRVASGVMVFFEAFAIAIIFGAFPNLVGMFLGSLPSFFAQKSVGSQASMGLKILCIFFMVEGILGIVITIIMAIVNKSIKGAVVGLMSAATFIGIGMFIKTKWNIR